MKLSEAGNLGLALENNCNNLVHLLYKQSCFIYLLQLTLDLTGNLIDDDLIRFIMSGLNTNISLIELILAHNKISDQG